MVHTKKFTFSHNSHVKIWKKLFCHNPNIHHMRKISISFVYLRNKRALRKLACSYYWPKFDVVAYWCTDPSSVCRFWLIILYNKYRVWVVVLLCSCSLFQYVIVACFYALYSGGIQIFYQPILFAKVVFSAGSAVSTNGNSTNSNAGWFSGLMEFLKTILWTDRTGANQLNPSSASMFLRR